VRSEEEKPKALFSPEELASPLTHHPSPAGTQNSKLKTQNSKLKT
jgi:hypothetical protein